MNKSRVTGIVRNNLQTECNLWAFDIGAPRKKWQDIPSVVAMVILRDAGARPE